MGRALAILCLLGPAAAQQAGTRSTEGAPVIDVRVCKKGGDCETSKKSVVLDANWRWVHDAQGWENCYRDGDWVAKYCKDPQECAEKCALEAVTKQEYESTYGISQIPGGVRLKFVSQGAGGANYGSRIYVLDDAQNYKMFQLKNREFTFDVDVSKLPCGLNGAVYFSEMERSGNKGGGNKAGAAYGTGYCDAQCPHDIKFINGEANVKNWDALGTPPTGHFGTCCAEMDIWEANSMATAYTAHPCKLEGQQRCEGVECGDDAKQERYQGLCDKDGCDFNAYRMGDKTFYGAGSHFALDSTRPFTVVTQFITSDGTDDGDLTEIRRFYVQDGALIENANSTALADQKGNSLTDAWCGANKKAFADTNDFQAKGAMRQMGQSLERGMVFVMSLWDDTMVNMLWLDASFPPNRAQSEPGVARGPCPGGRTSEPAYLRSAFPDASVTYTNLAYGEIGSTFKATRKAAATAGAAADGGHRRLAAAGTAAAAQAWV